MIAYDWRTPDPIVRKRFAEDAPRDLGATHHAAELPILCVGRRVDYLCLAFAVELSPEALRQLKAKGNLALKCGCASIELPTSDPSTPFVAELLPVKVKPREDGGPSGRWVWASKHSRGTIDVDAPGGWTVEITIAGAQWLENPNVELQLDWCLKIANALGRVMDERADRGARLRRLDPSADFENMSIEDLERDQFVMPKGVHRKGSLARYTPEMVDDEELREVERMKRPRGGGRRAVRRRCDAQDVPAIVRYENALQVTGHTICAGNDIMAKAYAKSVELMMPQRMHKAAVEQARWTAHGWKGGPVTRIEFQIRTGALAEFNMRDPWDVLRNLDAVWQYLTQKWVRIVEARRPGQRAREAVSDRRWRAVNDVRFYGPAEPIKRMRNRGGASEDQAFGAVLSCLAGSGNLARLAREPLHRAMVDDASGAEQAEYITSVVFDVMVTFAAQVVGTLLAAPKTSRVLTNAGAWREKESHADAVERLSTKMDAKYARFHEGSLHEPERVTQYWHARGDGSGALHLTLQTSRPGARSLEAAAAGPIDAAPS